MSVTISQRRVASADGSGYVVRTAINWNDFGARAHFADPPLPEDYWARDLVAAHGMPAVLKALARYAKGRGWREAFCELTPARGQPHAASVLGLNVPAT